MPPAEPPGLPQRPARLPSEQIRRRRVTQHKQAGCRQADRDGQHTAYEREQPQRLLQGAAGTRVRTESEQYRRRQQTHRRRGHAQRAGTKGQPQGGAVTARTVAAEDGLPRYRLLPLPQQQIIPPQTGCERRGQQPPGCGCRQRDDQRCHAVLPQALQQGGRFRFRTVTGQQPQLPPYG